MMNIEIKSIHSPDIDDLLEYQPEKTDNFSFLLQLFIGPKNEKGEESFNLVVCTPKWLIEHHQKDEILMGYHYLLMFEYNFERLMGWLQQYVSSCTGHTWNECAKKLSRLGKWEFENYK